MTRGKMKQASVCNKPKNYRSRKGNGVIRAQVNDGIKGKEATSR